MISVNNSTSNDPFYPATVSGSFKIEVLDTYQVDGVDFFELEIEGLTPNKFKFNISADDAGGSTTAPDPGDVFRTLMKWLKELLCPECL